MKLGVLTYLPPPTFDGVHTFRLNLEKFMPKFPLIAYSEHEYKGAIKLKGSPEVAKGARMPDGSVNKFATNNMAFFTGLRIAKSQGYTHIIYLEADVRLGKKNWDAMMFEEYFNAGRPLVAGGTLACYNPCNYSTLAAKRWEQLVSRNLRRNVPIATYGWLPAAQKGSTFVFANGALSVLDLEWMGRLFDLDQTLTTAQLSTAWDMEIGKRLWEKFKEDAFDVLANLTCIYSGYGDVLTTQEERLDMLRRGDVCCVHQVKGEVEV